MRPRWSRTAKAELREALLFYRDIDPRLATRLNHEAERIAALLCEFPEMGAQVAMNVRRIGLRGFPYALAYYAAGDRLHLVIFAHGSRGPEFWRQRLDLN